MNIYDRFRTVGKNRRAWAVGLVYEDAPADIADFDWMNVLGGAKGMPLLGIAEVLSQTDYAMKKLDRTPIRAFDVRLSNGREYIEFLYMQKDKRGWKTFIPMSDVEKIAYSAGEMLKFYRSRTINRHLPKHVADSVEIIGAQLAVLGIK